MGKPTATRMTKKPQQSTPVRRQRLNYEKLFAEADAELEAMFGDGALKRWRAEADAQFERIRKARETREADKRERLSQHNRSRHPNRGKTSAPQRGRWVWSEEVPISPEESLPPAYPCLMCAARGVRAKRLHRLRVLGFEQSAAEKLAALDGHPPESRFLFKWDIREDRENEADVKRRWTNAQQRIRRGEKRRAAHKAVTTG